MSGCSAVNSACGVAGVVTLDYNGLFNGVGGVWVDVLVRSRG